MSDIEINVLGIAFALCAATFFMVAVPLHMMRFAGPGKPPPLPKGKVSTSGFGSIDLIGVSVIFGYYALNWYAARSSDGGEAMSESKNLVALLFLNIVLQGMMIAAVIVFLFWRMNVVEAFGLKWRKWYWIILIGPMIVWLMWSFLAVLQSLGYNEWMADLMGGEVSQESVKLLQENENVLALILMAVVACLGAPLAEEVVFRGYLYGAMKRFTNIPVAVLFTGVLFGAVHLNLAALLPLTVLGITLAVLYEVTGSLWAPIVVHCLYNSGTVVVQFLMRLNPEWQEKAQENAAIIGLG